MDSTPSPRSGPSIAILTGVTASGKTALALEAAERHGLEIINADSLLVYRGMDIGTAKPTRAELARVPHHLIDTRRPDEPYNAADYVRGVEQALADVAARGKRALIAGGTGFYLKALIYGVWAAPGTSPEFRASLEAESSQALYERLAARDPQAAGRITPGDRYRLVRALEVIEGGGRTPTELEAEQGRRPADPRFALLVTDRESDELSARIEARARQMIQDGLLDEVQRLREEYAGARALAAVGYAQAAAYLDSAKPPGRALAPGQEGLVAEIALATRQLVKRQRTWFKGQLEGEHFVLDRDRTQITDRLREVYAT